ncbi:MAG: nicotinate (nicotinamide) nucleotide adenylyltransferase [Rubricoccaceae bacterium]|nr:nicotinate (nicotinamide) nucleotide adenylyltransferase [Rubricoccaceae bacterium]
MSVCPETLLPGSRLALFGGSFNPPHIAHLAVAEAILEEAHLDYVLWMPAATSPHKTGDSTLASPAHRLAMVAAAIGENDKFLVSDWEIQQGGVSYTVDTLRALTSEQKNVQLFLVLGGDSLAGFDTWKEPQQILELAGLLVYGRDPSDMENVRNELKAKVTIVEAPRLDLSSTELRERVSRGKSVRYLVHDEVWRYIRDNNLYR